MLRQACAGTHLRVCFPRFSLNTFSSEFLSPFRVALMASRVFLLAGRVTVLAVPGWPFVVDRSRGQQLARYDKPRPIALPSM